MPMFPLKNLARKGLSNEDKNMYGYVTRHFILTMQTTMECMIERHWSEDNGPMFNPLWPSYAIWMASHNLVNIGSGNGLIPDDT